MIVLGIDTSLTCTGLARVDVVPIEEDDDPLAAFVMQVASAKAPPPGKDKSTRAMARRVQALLQQIEACFREETIDHVGIEGLAYGAKGAGVWVLPWIWGETIALCETYDVPLTVVSTSARAKFATGKGNAPKDTVLLAASRLFPGVEFTDNNEADAAIIAAVVCQQLGVPILPVTSYRTEVMAKLSN